ncbi:hypothetical protein JCM30237_25580 [Halolamina litorea]|uniref:Dolichyl-phosphate-mannose-protein mannosyltransferase n=1 Tax=Halolamina litorea TaxID=1515593 RepID=A0ABD6BVD0_9EURY|nr:hypothetical protein [Halolamina litorea]
MSRTPSRYPKVSLVVGYVGLTIAVAVARQNPATGYELSLYGATPTVVWLGLAAAFLAGTTVALLDDGDYPNAAGWYTHRAALVLIGAVALSVLSMPILRGYTFYGPGDSLSHAGWAREIAAGSLAPTELLYPGVHTATVIVARVADVATMQANLYVVLVAFPLTFLLFVPASVRLLTGAPRAGAIGLLAAAAFVPVNNIAVHATAHPASQAILLFAFVLYLVFAYAATGLDSRASVATTRSMTAATGSMLLLTGPAFVFVHPQQALNAAAFLCGALGLQWGIRRYRSDHPIVSVPSLLPPTAALLGAFLIWTPRFSRVQGAAEGILTRLLTSGETGAAVVGAKSTSLTTVGGSLLEVYLKLFGGATLLSVFAAVALLAGLWHHRRSPLALLLTAGLVPVVGLFFVMLAASYGDMYFRYQGFLMVPIAVAGAAGVAGLRGRLTSSGWSRSGAALALVIVLVIAPAGLAVVHSSPYVYQPSGHVSAQQVDGYGAAFEARDPDVPFTGLRGGPRRYVDYHYGTQYARDVLAFPGYERGIRPAVFAAANYSDAFDGPRYLTITEATYEQETGLYEGFRYPRRGFRALKTTPGVDRIRANDGFRLYRVEGGEES